MKLTARAAILAVVALWTALLIAGCGGGGKRSADPGAPGESRAHGGLAISVTWPEKITRLIPDAAEFIYVEVVKVSAPAPVVAIPPTTLKRPAPGQSFTTRVDYPGLEVGDYTITVRAFADPDKDGNVNLNDPPVARTTYAFTLTDGENEVANLTLGSTIATLEVQQVSASIGSRLRVGDTRQFFVIARDAAGKVIITTPLRITYTAIANGSFVSLVKNNTTGGLTVTATSTPNRLVTDVVIEATETESGKKSSDTGGINGRVQVAATGLAGTLTDPSPSASWPKFHADQRNTGQAGTKVVGTLGNGVGRAFYDVGAANPIVFSSPAIGPDPDAPDDATKFVLYIGDSNGRFYAIKADGTLYWDFQTPTRDTTGATEPIESTAVVGRDGTVYVSSMNGTLYAFDTKKAAVGSQTPRWTFQINGAFYASPTIDNNSFVYIGSTTSLDGTRTSDAGKFYCIDGLTGLPRWAAPFQAGDDIQSSASLSANQTLVYVGSFDRRLYALASGNGAKQWEFATNDAIFASPAVSTVTNEVVIGSLDGNMYGLDALTGPTLNGAGQPQAKWTFDPGKLPDPNDPTLFLPSAPIFSSPAVATDGSIYFGTFDNVSGQDRSLFFGLKEDGTANWAAPFPVGADGGVTSSPAVGTDGFVSFGSFNDRVYTLDGIDGSLKAGWPFVTGNDVESSPAYGPDGTIYIGSVDGKVYAIK